MSDQSVIIEPLNTWRPNDKHSSQTRISHKEQSKRRHRSKKKRRHRSSSSSSSSRLASSDSHKKSKKSKRPKHSHERRRRRSTSSSSSSHSTQSENDYGRYKRVKQAPQVAEIPVPLQPAEPINMTPNLPENVLQTAKDSGSDSDAEVWSFDRAINEVCRLLSQELCPKTPQEQTPVKPKSVDFHQIDGHNSIALTSTCHFSFSVPRQLADKTSDSQSITMSDKILPSNSSRPRFHSKSNNSELIPAQNFTFIGMEFLL